MANAEHRAIVDAAKRGEVDATIRLLVAHSMCTAESVTGALEPNNDLSVYGLQSEWRPRASRLMTTSSQAQDLQAS
jgi:hypothetical protein